MRYLGTVNLTFLTYPLFYKFFSKLESTVDAVLEIIFKVFVLATSTLNMIIEDFEFASQQICDCKQKLTSHKLIPDLQ